MQNEKKNWEMEGGKKKPRKPWGGPRERITTFGGQKRGEKKPDRRNFFSRGGGLGNRKKTACPAGKEGGGPGQSWETKTLGKNRFNGGHERAGFFAKGPKGKKLPHGETKKKKKKKGKMGGLYNPQAPKFQKKGMGGSGVGYAESTGFRPMWREKKTK
ncbi:hypothetical protein RKK42_31260 [Klebsiella pneumoniae]|nr:hypothetical protein [Klebsiella pneumoniae]